MKRVLGLAISGCLLLALPLIGCSGSVQSRAQEALDAYNMAVSCYGSDNVNSEYDSVISDTEAANKELEAAIADAQALIDAGDKPYSEDAQTALEDAIAAAQEAEVAVPEDKSVAGVGGEELSIPEGVSNEELEQWIADVDAKTEDLISKGKQQEEDLPDVPDYTTQLNALKSAGETFSASVEIRQKVVAPTVSSITAALKSIDKITTTEDATNGGDAYDNLGADDRYKACVYFGYEGLLADGKTPLQAGISAGGCIEVWTTSDKAAARVKELAAADGTWKQNGSHTQLGVMVIRVSDNLSADDQEALTKAITDAILS